MLDLRSVREKIYEAIKFDILTGRLAQGERISSMNLSERFQVSPQPVRDAIIRLTEEGLVHVRARYGTFVTMVSKENIEDLGGAREMIEPYALNHITKTASSREWQLMQAALDNMNKIIDSPHYDYLAYNNQDYEFHLALVMLAGNDTITGVYRKLHPHYVYSMVMYRHASTMLGNHRDHTIIAKALARGDTHEAESTCVAHVRYATAQLLELMSNPSQKLPQSGSDKSYP